jgi:hypothetical protein
LTVAEVLEIHDLTTPSQDGWALDYRIRREHGEELHAEVRCWERARATADGQGTTRLSLRLRIAELPLHSNTRRWSSRRRRAVQC